MSYKINENVELTPVLISKLVTKFKQTELPRLKHLEDYYLGRHKILTRTMADINKPNNKVVSPYANYITDMFTGYFMGEPVNYGDADEELKMIFNYNDEQDENSQLAKDCSVFGVGYEMLYVDRDGATRFKKIDPREIVIIEDDTIENEMLYAIRFYLVDDLILDSITSVVEVYTRDEIRTYAGSADYTGLTLQSVVPHFFSIVPFVEFKNNDDKIGDFELVISAIDAYDQLNADGLNDFEAFVDAYLTLTGVDATSDDIATMKEQRVMLLPEGANAEWLIKNAQDTTVENMKTRLDKDIHKFSKCPALTDEDFAANASGVAMKYKVMGMENVASTKERKFKKGLQRRIEAIANILSLSDSGFDWRSVEIIFKRSLPVNTAEVADVVAKLRGLVSDYTLISQIPFVQDVDTEIDKLNEEKEDIISIVEE